jgi:hypothetical protein
MATTAELSRSAVQEEPGLVWGSWLMIIAAIGFIGYAILFFVRDLSGGFLELGIGPNEVNVGKAQIEQFSPSLYAYISHLQIALSGFIAAVGIAVIFLTLFGVRRGMFWAWVGAVVAPVFALAVALPDHYLHDHHFDTMGHLGLIYLAVVIFTVGAVLALIPLWKARGEKG